MLDRVRTADICFVCKCSLDTTAPHAIVNHEYAHLDCADTWDARDLGAVERIELFGDSNQDYADAVCIRLTGEL